MKRKLGVLAFVSMLLVLGSTTALAAPLPESQYAAQIANAPAVLETTFKINVVFVGYEMADIDMPNFEAELPSTYDPLVILPYIYYDISLPINIHGDYEYNYVFADSSFNDSFFGYLTSIGKDGTLTEFQEAYNTQSNRSITIEPPHSLYIDAPSTELWLMNHGRSDLGLDVANYTIFFVNWYGRSDFRFHVYTKTDDPDPDTGVNFGQVYDQTKMIAWGGSYGRTWFYDLSAGPEAWSSNWDINTSNVDGDSAMDYRMPPVWEYGNMTGYRPFDNLSGDLGKVARWLAIDLLFTTNPVYDPLVTEPFPGFGKRLFINMFEDDPNSNGPDWIDKPYIRKTMQHLQPDYKWRVTLKDQPLKGSGLQGPFRIWAGLRNAPGCWGPYGDPFAELFCYVDTHRNNYLPPIKPLQNKMIGVFAFNTTDERMGNLGGLLGYSDDDWMSGTPTYVFEFDTPGTRATGFGFSTTTTHEVGHHIGLAHPHDGYDSEADALIDPTGDYYFVWTGDESHSIMQYIAVANQFGWFDRDNMNRFLTGRYLTRSSEIAAELTARENSREANALLQDANARLDESRRAFGAMDYAGAAKQARAGFERVWRAAQLAGLNPPMAKPLPAGVRTNKPKMVDPIPHPFQK